MCCLLAFDVCIIHLHCIVPYYNLSIHVFYCFLCAIMMIKISFSNRLDWSEFIHIEQLLPLYIYEIYKIFVLWFSHYKWNSWKPERDSVDIPIQTWFEYHWWILYTLMQRRAVPPFTSTDQFFVVYLSVLNVITCMFM